MPRPAMRGLVEAGQDAAKLPLIAMVIAALVVSIVSAFGSVGAVWVRAPVGRLFGQVGRSCENDCGA
jgi:hypothetical protein